MNKILKLEPSILVLGVYPRTNISTSNRTKITRETWERTTNQYTMTLLTRTPKLYQITKDPYEYIFETTTPYSY